ncbi:MAG: DegV family protein [Suipraeoptans sp.]
MEKIAVVTDSNSGITQNEAKELGIWVLPMPFSINGDVFFEDITLTQEDFYKHLSEDADISTSMPAVGDVLALWNKLLESFDKIIHIPMSSGLSSSCETAMMLAKEFDNRVLVIDNQRISVTQKYSVYDAIRFIEEGKTAEEIKAILIQAKLEASIYIMVDTLKYLKKGGRVTPAAAAIGSVLNIKPILQIQGEKLDSFAKARGIKNGKKIMLEAMERDIAERFENSEINLALAHTCPADVANEWKREIEDRFPGYPLVADRLSLSVSCHIGPGALAIACSKKI